ncbi:MAG: YgiQ family radical SAM protein [bacterium]
MFIPTTEKEIKELGWDRIDIVLVTGDAYIDSPHIGVAVIGKILLQAGYKVGIIAQPDVLSGRDIKRLGEPGLFWGVTGGCIDSMVANYTATGRKRRQDDYTPGGENNNRPDRAVIAYSNLIRKYFKATRPIVLGGIEASLRRIAHYDFWSDKIRRSVLFDAKGDYLAYGMAEQTVVEMAECLKEKKHPGDIRGLCYISREKPEACLELPSFQDTERDKQAFAEMFRLFYNNSDPSVASTLAQKQDTRYLVQNPPPPFLMDNKLDAVYNLKYERDLHPFYSKMGRVRALDTIRFSITTHQGCLGECNFCSIAVHQGRKVRRRSKNSILAEAREMAAHPLFKGNIQDVGGPTANMYGMECSIKNKKAYCLKKRCLFPKICPDLKIDHGRQVALLKELRSIKGIKKVFIASGIRHDLVLQDKKQGIKYMQQVIRHHVSGQLKIAPEHSQANVLNCMGKPSSDSVLIFKDLFYRLTGQEKKKQFLTYYLIAAHPGCSRSDMAGLKSFCRHELGIIPEQIQVFIPIPSTYSALMYHTECNPFTGKPCFVEKNREKRAGQKDVLLAGAKKKLERGWVATRKSGVE